MPRILACIKKWIKYLYVTWGIMRVTEYCLEFFLTNHFISLNYYHLKVDAI